MKIAQVLGGVGIPISNEEESLCEKIRQNGRIHKGQLDEREKELVRLLVNRGVLDRQKDHDGIYFTYNAYEE